MNTRAKLYAAAGVAVLAAVAWVSIKGASAVGAALGGAAVDVADGVLSGAVTGAGRVVGIPQTSADKCAADTAAGDLWAASFSCPAARFLQSIFD